MDIQQLHDYIVEQNKKNQVGIPLQFQRFHDYLPNIMKGDSLIITAGSGVSKTSFAIDKFLMQPLNWCKTNNVNLVIDYFSLEETTLRFDLKLLSYQLYQEFKTIISPSDLINRKGKQLVDDKISKQILALEPFFEYFRTHVRVIDDVKTPIGIYKRVKENLPKTDYLNENTYYFVIIDNLKFVKPDTQKDEKGAIDELCLVYLQDLRTKYNVIPIVIQHQVGAGEEKAFNMKGDLIEAKLKPSCANLGISKYTQDPATHIIGLFAPERYGIKKYNGYDIDIFQDNIRFLSVLKNRDGTPNKELALYYNGACSHFSELERPEEFDKNIALYNKYNLKLPTTRVNTRMFST